MNERKNIIQNKSFNFALSIAIVKTTQKNLGWAPHL